MSKRTRSEVKRDPFEKSAFDFSNERGFINEFQEEIKLENTFLYQCVNCNKEDIWFYSTNQTIYEVL